METYNHLNDGDLNPKVQIELERLNTTSSQLNEFENKLQDLRNAFNETLSIGSSNLTEMSNKIGSPIFRARRYFESKSLHNEMQRESQIAASRYESACAELSDAIAVVNKSELSAKETSRLDDSAMEVLNIAIAKVNLAKKDKITAHAEHQEYLSIYMDLERKIRLLERRYKNDIKKSSDYFIFKKDMDDKLKEDKLNIEAYEEKIKICKTLYNKSLQHLEEISNKIHEERRYKERLGPRGEGVGAEQYDSVTLECFCEPMKLTGDSKTEIKAHIDSSEYDWSFSSTTSANTSTYHRHVSEPGIRRSRLSSSTPIIDGLLKAALDNQMTFLNETQKQFSNALPHNFHSTQIINRKLSSESMSSPVSNYVAPNNSNFESTDNR